MILVLNELKFSDARTLKHKADKNAWVEYLQQNNFLKYGSGMYSVVYGKEYNSNLVVRISKDKAWLQFYEFAYKNQRKNKHLPRIGKIIQSSDDWYLVFMERLERTKLPLEVEMYLDNVIARKDSEHTTLAYYKETLEFFGPEFMKLFEYLYKNRGTAHWDLHDANIMRRSNGDFVIIDPYYFSKRR